MFCKWCGADLPNSATKCARCGKEVPAMSDCGGFYDLVPGAKRNSEAINSAQPALKKEKSQIVDAERNAIPMREDIPKGKKSNGHKRLLSLLINCIGFILVIMLLLRLNGKVAPFFTDSMSLLEMQDIKINIDVKYVETDISVKTTADLGEFDDSVTDTITFDKDNRSFAGAKIDLSDAQNCIEVAIENTVDSSDLSKGTMKAVLAVNDDLFAKADGNEEYIWAYRTTPSAKWETLSEDIFTVSADGTTVTYNVSKLDKLFSNDAEVVEFRLKYKRSNEKGGTLTVIISGISIAKD